MNLERQNLNDLSTPMQQESGIFLRIFLDTIAGVLCGAILGALLLGIPTYFHTGNLYSTPIREWTWGLAFWGAICGAVIWGFLGLAIGVLKVNKERGAMIGLGVGIVLSLITFYVMGNFNSDFTVIGILPTPIGSLIGLGVASIDRYLYRLNNAEDEIQN